jgi:ATP-dependent exoDNAse (exonuclease V) beta subunit
LFQTTAQAQKFQSLHNKVAENFVTDTPRHALEDGSSWVSILAERDFSEKSSAEVQETVRTRTIVIQPDADKHIAFDREFFVDTLGHGNMKYVVPMEGESLY